VGRDNDNDSDNDNDTCGSCRITAYTYENQVNCLRDPGIVMNEASMIVMMVARRIKQSFSRLVSWPPQYFGRDLLSKHVNS
jgi:hypothetical protein